MLNERLLEMTHNSYSNHNDSISNEICCRWFEFMNIEYEYNQSLSSLFTLIQTGTFKQTQ